MKIKKIFIICLFCFLTGVNFCQVQASSSYTMPTGTGLPENSDGIKGILTNFLSWILGIVGIIGIIGFVISGILYLTSAGDNDRMETAKKSMYYSLMGIIIALSGYIVVKAVDTMLRGSGMF